MDKLFVPTPIGGVQLKNRLIMGGFNLGFSPDGDVNERLYAYYKERAQWSAALIIVGPCAVDPAGRAFGMIRLDEDEFLKGHERLAASLARRSCVSIAGLFHGGSSLSQKVTGMEPVSASAIRSRLTGETPRALDVEEVKKLVDSYGEAADRAKRAGYLGVCVDAARGYLISQFLAPRTNKRNDEYGGSQENRQRLALEIASRIKETCGDDFVLIYRISGNDLVPEGCDAEDAKKLAVALEEKGVHALEVVAGWNESRVPLSSLVVPRGGFSHLWYQVRRAVKIPVIASGRVNEPYLAHQLVREGKADLVNFGRAFLIDSEFAQRTAERFLERIHYCIACNECIDMAVSNKPVECSLSPRSGKELTHAIHTTDKPKKVLIVGGGPAGLEAARVASLRGHNVTICEKTHNFGGQVFQIAAEPSKAEYFNFVSDRLMELQRQGVQTAIRTEVTPRYAREVEPDILVLATGPKTTKPKCEVEEGAPVVTSKDVMLGISDCSPETVIVGGDTRACAAALMLARRGAMDAIALNFSVQYGAEPAENLKSLVNDGWIRVTLLNASSAIAESVGVTTRWITLADLKRFGVVSENGVEIKKFRKDGVEWTRDGEKHFTPAGTIVWAEGYEKDDDTETAYREVFRGTDTQVVRVGDAREPRNVKSAIYDAFETVREL